MIIFTTVGTSLLDHAAKDKLGENKDQLRNQRASNCDCPLYKRIKRVITEGYSTSKKQNAACAELSCIEKIKERYPQAKPTVRLLCSDSAESRLCGEIIKQWLDARRIVCNAPQVIEGLVVDRKDLFEKVGMPKLYHALRDEQKKLYRNDLNTPQDPCVVYNINGGYKAAIPFLTVFAQMTCAPIFYVFEDSDELLQVPQMPVKVDYAALLPHREFLLKLREGETKHHELQEYAGQHGAYETFLQNCIVQDPDLPMLNAMGELFLDELKQVVYQIRFYEWNNDKHKQKQLKEAAKRIANALFLQNNCIPNNMNDLLNHAPETNRREGGFYISKQQGPSLLRLAYTFEEVVKTIAVHDFLFVNAGHDGYVDDFIENVPWQIVANRSREAEYQEDYIANKEDATL